MTEPTLDTVFQALNELGVKYRIDRSTKSTKNFKAHPSCALVLVNEALIRTKDPYHPEIVLCVLARWARYDTLFYTIVKHSGVDVKTHIERWNSPKAMYVYDRDPKCVSCKEELDLCNMCEQFSCMKCKPSITDQPHAWLCTLCDQWNLRGTQFGIPHSEHHYLQPNGTTSGEKIADMVTRVLDGEVLVQIWVNDKQLSGPMVVCRPSFSSRLVRNNTTPQEISKRIDGVIRKYDPHTNDIRLVLRRLVWGAHKQDRTPTYEVSHFNLFGENQIVQLPCFDGSLADLPGTNSYSLRRDVEYLGPAAM